MSQATRFETRGVGLKALAVAGLFCLLAAIGILNTVPPADGYEISLYRVYPWHFWGALVVALFIGKAVIVGSKMYAAPDDRSWVFGLGLVLVSGGVLLFIPVVRGYPVFGRGDVLTHIGFVHDITEIGITGNIYPLMHLLVHSLSQATGLPPAAIIKFVPIAVSLVFFGSLFYLMLNLYNRTHAFYALPFVLILFVGYKQAVPFVLSVLYVPFVLYLFVKEQRTRAIPVRVFLVASVFGLVLFHPLTTMFLIVVMGLYLGVKATSHFRARWSGPTLVPSLMVVLFSAWNLHFIGIVRRFEAFVERFTGAVGGESRLEQVSQTVNTFSPDLFDLVVLAIFDYGILLLYAFALLFVLFVVYLRIHGQKDLNIFLTLFIGVVVLFTGLSAVLFVNDFVIGWGRVLYFGNLFAAVLAASLFYFLHRHLDFETQRNTFTFSLGAVLFVLTLLVVFTAFASIPARTYNEQVTEMEIDGSEWILDNRNETVPVDQSGLALWRYENFHEGTLNTTVRKQDTQPPDHFGYDGNETLGQSYEQDRYLVVTALGRWTYPEVFSDYPEYWRFTPVDFGRLERDTSVSRIYDNGDFEAYRTAAEE